MKPILIFVSVLFCFFIVSGLFLSLVNNRFYIDEVNRLNLESSNIEKNSVIMDFVNGNNNKIGSIGLTTNEISHLNDVRNIFNKIRIFLVSSVLIFVILLFVFYKRISINNMFFVLLLSGIIIDIFIVVLLFAFINFDFSFVLFHKILFPQGNWMFSANSLIIQIYPERFFIDFVASFITNLAIVANVFVMVYFLYRYNIRYRNKK